MSDDLVNNKTIDASTAEKDLKSEYLRILDSKREELKAALLNYSSSPALYRGEPVPLSLFPIVYYDNQALAFANIVRKFNKVLLKTLEALAEDRNLLDFLSFSPEELNFIRLDEGRLKEALEGGKDKLRTFFEDSLCFLRYDTILSPIGQPYFCEINADALGGLSESYESGRVLEALSAFKKLKCTNYVDEVLKQSVRLESCPAIAFEELAKLIKQKVESFEKNNARGGSKVDAGGDAR